MSDFKHEIEQILHSIQEEELNSRYAQAEAAHKAFIKIAQQAPGNAYSYFDQSSIPPAISAMLANLNYKVTQLTQQQQQMSQQMSGTGQQQKQNQQSQQNQQYNQELQNINQNPVTPNTVNYIQTPGSTAAPIETEELNV